MKISFTTLACVDWKWDDVVNNAESWGYDGIEVRGAEGEMFLPKARPFVPENIDNTLGTLKQKGLEICCLDTSCSFHDPAGLEAAIREGKATIDLAQKMKVPYIRVFGNSIPDPEKKNETIDRVASALRELSQYAQDNSVCVLIETHGDFSSSDNLLEVLEQSKNPALGVLWDVNHPYKAFEEPVKETFAKLGAYIRHVHMKDSKGPGKDAQLCLTGDGDLPLVEIVEVLRNNGYTGWLSLEWEKKWHPDLEASEVALPAYVEYIRKLL